MFLKFKRIWQIQEVKNKRKVIIAITLLFFSSLLDLLGVASILPFLLSLFDPSVIKNNYYINELNTYFNFNEKELVFFLAISSFIIIVVNQGLRLLSKWYSLALSENLLYENSKNLFHYYLKRPYFFFLGQNSSHLLQRCTNYVNSTIGGFITPALLIFGSFLTSLFVLVFLLIYNPYVTIILFSSLAIFYLLFFNRIKNTISKLSNTLPEHYSNTAKTIGDAFGSIKETLMSNNQRYFVDQFSITAKNVKDAQVKMNLYNQLPIAYVEIFSFGILISIFLLLFIFYPNFNQTIPLLGLIAISLKRLVPAVQELYLQFLQMRFYKSTYTKIIGDLEKSYNFRNNYRDTAGAQNASVNFSNKIEFKNISFKYNKKFKKAVDVNLVIKKGNFVGICGFSGHGKTTFLDILCGLLRQNSGEFLIDNKKLEDKHLIKWRKKISYVPQFGYLLNDTVQNNILFGSNDRNKNRLIKVLKLVDLYDFFKKNNYNLNTKIGENGIRLSGGQQQRLIIARALYKKTDLIVLDEATSALDLATSKRIIDNLKKEFKFATIIIATHRVELLKRCNKIILFNNGKVDSSGDYKKLNKNKNFKKLKILNNKEMIKNENKKRK